MSLDKAIEHGKEHRKPYRGLKDGDRWCVNHGKDDFANKARLFSFNKTKYKWNEKLKDFINNGSDYE